MNSKRQPVWKGIIIILLSLCAGLTAPSCVFGQDNPFDLTPRLERQKKAEGEATDTQETGNPFDLVRHMPALDEKSVLPAPRAADSRVRHDPPEQYRRVKLFVVFGILILLAVSVTLLRSLFTKAFRAFWLDTAFNQLYRDQQGRGVLPFLLLYAMFFVNAGVFIFFITKYFQLPLSVGNWTLLLFCILGVTGLFLLKHLLLAYLGFTFPIEKEIGRYHFIIIIFSIIIGLFLIPVNMLMAYSSDEGRYWVLIVSLVSIAAIYLFRHLRSLFIAGNFLSFHKFHFLLYICTVEIAPVLFLFKLIAKQL